MVHLSLGIQVSFLQGTCGPLHHSESSCVSGPRIGLKAIPWVPPVRICQSSVHGTLLNISLVENPAWVILLLDEIISIQCFGRCEIELDASLSFLWEDVINHKCSLSLTKEIHNSHHGFPQFGIHTFWHHNSLFCVHRIYLSCSQRVYKSLVVFFFFLYYVKSLLILFFENIFFKISMLTLIIILRNILYYWLIQIVWTKTICRQIV